MTRASRWNSGIQSSSTVPRWTPRTTTVPPGATSSIDRARLAAVPGGLDDDVVPARRRRRARPGARPPPAGAGGAPRGSPRRRPAGAHRRRRAARAPRADDRHPLPGPGLGETQARATRRSPARRSMRRARRGPAAAARDAPRRAELLRHPAVGGHPERALPVRRAEVVRAAPALLALHAPVERFDDDGGAVLADAGELVAEDLPESPADVAEVGRAHARRLHLEELAGPGGSSTSTTTTPPSGRAHRLHRPRQTGARFSTNAVAPSFASSLVNTHVLPLARRARARVRRRTRPAGRAPSPRRATAERWRRSAPRARARHPAPRPGGTTALTSPSSYARAASMPIAGEGHLQRDRRAGSASRGTCHPRREQAALHLGQAELAPRTRRRSTSQPSSSSKPPATAVAFAAPTSGIVDLALDEPEERACGVVRRRRAPCRRRGEGAQVHARAERAVAGPGEDDGAGSPDRTRPRRSPTPMPRISAGVSALRASGRFEAHDEDRAAPLAHELVGASVTTCSRWSRRGRRRPA